VRTLAILAKHWAVPVRTLVITGSATATDRRAPVQERLHELRNICPAGRNLPQVAHRDTENLCKGERMAQREGLTWKVMAEHFCDSPETEAT
jgi:hypothetical protein